MTELKDVRETERVVFDDTRVPGAVYYVVSRQDTWSFLKRVDVLYPTIVMVKHAFQHNGEPRLVHGEVLFTNDATCRSCGGRLEPIEPAYGWPRSIHVKPQG